MTTINTNVFSTSLKDANRDRLISDVVSEYDQLEDEFLLVIRQYRFKNVEAFCLIADRDKEAYSLYKKMVKRYGISELNKRYAVC